MRQSRVIKPVTVIWVVMMLARASGAFEPGLAWNKMLLRKGGTQ